MSGNLDNVKLLLSSGASGTKRDGKFRTEFVHCILCINFAMNSVYLLRVLTVGRLKWTPLHWAVVGGNPQVVQTLLTLNIPLLSVRSVNASIIRALLMFGLLQVNGKSPLDLAKDEEHYNPQVVNMLISHTLHMNRTRGNAMTIQMN